MSPWIVGVLLASLFAPVILRSGRGPRSGRLVRDAVPVEAGA